MRTILCSLIFLITPTAYADGLGDFTKAIGKALTDGKKVIDKGLTDGREVIDKGLTDGREVIDKGFTDTKKELDKGFTEFWVNSRREVDKGLINMKTEWNYFFATVCGVSPKIKKIERDFDQRRITKEEREQRLSELESSRPCGGGVQRDNDGTYTLLDASGQKSETPEKTTNSGDKDILDWMKKVEVEEWEKELDKMVFGWIVPKMVSVTWFNETPGNITKTNQLRKAHNGKPLMGARRWRNGIPVLHKGTDHATAPGDPIFAAFSGTVTFHKNIWKGFDMVRVTSPDGHRQETLYVAHIDGLDYNKTTVERGHPIASAANIRNHESYKNVPNHVHTNFISPEKIYISPSNNFGMTADREWVNKYCEKGECISVLDNLSPEDRERLAKIVDERERLGRIKKRLKRVE